MTYLLGLTGGIATGKSTVSRYFIQLGIPLIDADKGARVVVEKGEAGLVALIAAFGEEILTKEGDLNRQKLAQIIFADKEKRLLLNSLLAPYIHKWLVDQIEQKLLSNPALLVLDIPLLFEAGYDQLVDGTMVVATTFHNQLERLKKRDKLTKATALQRIEAQLPLTEKIARAHVLIDNNHSIEQTERQVKDWLKKHHFFKCN